jgi:phytoene dehydrogenase-like protein
MDAFDAVVLGAGHNGLAAAIHLLKRGWSVAVIEQAGEPGGAVKTREITLPGFRHDLCAMNLSMFAGSPFFAAYKDELTVHGLAFAPAAGCFASVFRDETFLGVSKDIEKTANAIAALSAKDDEAWRAMLARFGEDAPYVFGLLGSLMPPLPPGTAYGPHGAPKACHNSSISAVSCSRRRGTSWTRTSSRRRSRL